MADFLRHLEIRHDTIADRSVYPFSIPALSQLERLVFHPSVTFLVGENGSGKSTLIEAIAIKAGFNPEGGNKNFTTSLRPSESSLHTHVRLARGTKRELGGFFLRAETMFNLATEVEEKELDKLERSPFASPSSKSPAWERIHEKSHGEAFLYVMQHRFRRKSLFVLDEPESALSPQRQLAALALIHQLVQDGCQFVIATHSPILMAYPDAHIFQLDAEQGVRQIAYRQTEHFVVTRAFLQNPEGMLARVLDGKNAIDDSDAIDDEAVFNDGTW